jgi:NOL1/NOP2/sun family putative RNA methylase
MSTISEEDKQLAKEYNYSPFMIRELIANFPADYLEVIKAFEKPPLKSIRVNLLKTTPEIVKDALEQKGFQLAKSEWLPYAFHVVNNTSQFDLGATHEYLHGWYYLQSYASMIPVHILYPEPKDTVLDMCAAPGSKTTQIGQYMQNKGVLVAIDSNRDRLNAVISNLKRCGVYNTIVFPMDSREVKKLGAMGFQPNKILLDAPCTGAGIIRSDPTRKHSRELVDVKEAAVRQKQLLKAGLELLAPNGMLLYSTCSFHYQENEQVVAEVVHQMKDIEIIEPNEQIGMPGLDKVNQIDFGYEMLKTRRLYPNVHDTDAFFFALLHKN